MQESSRGADHGSDLHLHVSFFAGNCSEHVYTLLIGYRSGGTPGFPQNLRARDGIAGRRRGSSACQRPSNLPALRVARRYSPVGFDRQHYVGLWSLKTLTNGLLVPLIMLSLNHGNHKQWPNGVTFLTHNSHTVTPLKTLTRIDFTGVGHYQC